VAYYRHSAEDKQEQSVPLQREYGNAFGAQYGIEIIHDEADEGKSGLLGPEHRPGFKRLLENWIENPDAPQFDYVLVYDESRWGRFQNPDEAAHYEFLCAQRGKKVIYMASGFPTEGNQLLAHLNTSMKRHMAAEFSRELSQKVFRGCVEVSRRGYSAGGIASYGMARMLLDADKNPMYLLKDGEHKAISNARVIFVPSEDGTADVVKRIFNLFVKEGKNADEIADLLNEEGVLPPKRGKWKEEKITRILVNEIYIGTRIYNKTWGRLKQKSRKNPRSEWVVTPNAFPALIDPETFQKAQEIIFWSAPSRWKRGFYLIRGMRRRIREELRQFLSERGVDPDEIFLALSRFPIIYSIPLSNQSHGEWCFVIPDKMRGSSIVLGIGVGVNRPDPLDRIFAIPTNELGLADFYLLSEKDTVYSRYFVEKEQIQEKVLAITKGLIKDI
jgi:DNA invertase Pin-like site-specific DNA recombinase